MPTIFADYNRGMGGVDLFDFLRNRYSIERIFRCNFWYKKLALGLLGMIATNAYIYWLSYNLMYPMDYVFDIELLTTGFLKFVVLYLSGGSLGNARTVLGCTYRPRVSFR